MARVGKNVKQQQIIALMSSNRSVSEEEAMVMLGELMLEQRITGYRNGFREASDMHAATK